jgi:tyrosyl-tRNA synthetase
MARRWPSPTKRWRSTTACCSVRSAPRAPASYPPATPSVRSLAAWLYSEQDAAAAERHFDRVFIAREAPEEIADAAFACEQGNLHLPGLIAQEFGISRSEARRLIDQGGVTLGEQTLTAGEHDVACQRADGLVLKVGRRRFRRLRAS